MQKKKKRKSHRIELVKEQTFSKCTARCENKGYKQNYA